ncbi:MAG TPA: CRISPR-associated protein Cas4 [Bryobacteraceae bacterium]|jgi:CRISPR-associated exonuclease Cas4|nr:CRISPR-associated protein Cas4 [Bryobacteraceae bacterium]
MYSEDDLLPLSGLQHMAFCERQWALIHLEQQWEENRLTADGRVLHERVHQMTEELRQDLLVVRGLPLHSFQLGVSGQADVVEFSRVELKPIPGSARTGVELGGRAGWWSIEPVEYKRGKAKRGGCDRVQLCAQAMCLEEMFGVAIAQGSLFYGTNRRRTVVRLSSDLRRQTEALALRMHQLFELRHTPRPVFMAGCASCSLKEGCLPERLGAGRPVASYYKTCLRED